MAHVSSTKEGVLVYVGVRETVNFDHDLSLSKPSCSTILYPWPVTQKFQD